MRLTFFGKITTLLSFHFFFLLRLYSTITFIFDFKYSKTVFQSMIIHILIIILLKPYFCWQTQCRTWLHFQPLFWYFATGNSVQLKYLNFILWYNLYYRHQIHHLYYQIQIIVFAIFTFFKMWLVLLFSPRKEHILQLIWSNW